MKIFVLVTSVNGEPLIWRARGAFADMVIARSDWVNENPGEDNTAFIFRDYNL